MKPLQLLLQSSIGKKVIMGATGAALVLFVIGHLVGNLQVFLPKEKINAYAHLLHSSAGVLWAVRLGSGGDRRSPRVGRHFPDSPEQGGPAR
jgi:succinate dehydrogenase / fumarate reductase, cytochrome b subunit